MTIRPIHVIPDGVLREKAQPVTAFDADLKRLVEDMFETMYAAPGIGLAAPQVGVMQRVFVVDVSPREDMKEPLAFINPEITWASDETSVYEEGCLSIPEYYEEVERPARVRMRFQDVEGKSCEIEADGVLATCAQHELDHLNGVLFIDHISKLKREMVWRKFNKQAKRDGGPQPWLPKPQAPKDLKAGEKARESKEGPHQTKPVEVAGEL